MQLAPLIGRFATLLWRCCALASAVSGFNSEEINAYSAVSTPYGAVGASGSAVVALIVQLATYSAFGGTVSGSILQVAC